MLQFVQSFLSSQVVYLARFFMTRSMPIFALYQACKYLDNSNYFLSSTLNTWYHTNKQKLSTTYFEHLSHRSRSFFIAWAWHINRFYLSA